MADTAPPTQAETDLARRLAHNDGWLHDDDSWDHANRDLRKDYLDLARTTLAVLGGPTEAQQQVAALATEVRELRRSRDRYREAWLSARARVRKARRQGGAS
ncbi:hypothetical protein [Streptomyces ortus]|uniref:Uncharacterized protein n=1 Tax=Streptomyces ortus TaxID=2867268 RepID=A0ABT3UWY8_9ACTN|nr:hypothetical protein [Streptomyces ortus]MCX4232074.1 hypothetical protein [Streptomyces ortus]